MAQRLTDQKIATMVQQLSVKGIALVAVIYMDTRFHEIENIKTAGGSDDQGILRKIIMRWRNSTQATVKKLADILKTSGIVDRKAIKKCLDVENFDKIEERQPGGDDDMDEWELARVAVKFNTRALERVILQLGNINQTEIDNIKYDNPDDGRFQLFEILVKWSRKTDNNRPILITALMDEKDADNEDIRKYVGELTSLPDSAPGKGNLTGETTSPKDGLTATDGGDPSSEQRFKKQKTEETPKPSQDPEISRDTTDGGEVPVYDVDPEHPGYVLIFNNNKFVGEPDRKGTEKDAQQLKQEFSQRGFKVVEENDLSAKDMTVKIKAFVKKDKLKSNEEQEEFLKDIKLKEKEIEMKKKILNNLEQNAFQEDWDLFKKRQTLIENKRNELHERMTERTKEKFIDTFGLTEDEVKEIDDPMTEAEMDAFKQKIKLGATEKKNIKVFLEKMKDEDLENTSCSVVVFMSHGGNGHIFDKQWKQIDIDKLVNEFTSDNCVALAGKPKAFLIQACRGEREDRQTDNEPEIDFVFKDNQAVPRCADMMIGFATTTGLVSYREKSSGSVFIQKFCKVVDKCANEMDVLSMTLKVNDQVAEKYDDVKQMSEFRHSLRKRWFLPKKDVNATET